MSQAAGAPAGVGGGVGLSQNMMAAGAATAPATIDAVAVPPESSFGGMPAVMRGMQNMLGKTPEEREANAKALAAGVKDINGIVSTMSESTLMQRMMEAQAGGMGFVTEPGGGGVNPIPRTFTPGVAAPVMSQLGFR